MPDKEFLENYPLYKKEFWENFPQTLDTLPKPPIKMYCDICKSEQTFNMKNEYYDLYGYTNPPTKKKIIRAQYVCMGCNEFHRYFFIKISPDLTWIQKVGQFPPWDISVENEIRKLLGKELRLFIKKV